MRANRSMIEQYFDNARFRNLAMLALFALFGLLYLALLGQRPLFIPDEMRYGEIAREMLATGDWVVPRLNGLLYFEKPPFGHWLNAISLAVFGENEFAVRFSSVLSTGASAVVVFAAGKHLFQSRALPYLATFVFLTTLVVQAIGTFSVLDPIFAAVLNAGIFVFATGAYSKGRGRQWRLFIAGVLFGLAFLAKGFLAFALPVLVLAPWLIATQQYATLFRHGWIAVAGALLVVAPWALTIHAQQPDFWRYFFWVEHIQRFASDNAQHEAPFYYYLLYLPVLAFPWIFLLPSVISRLRNDSKRTTEKGALLLLALWAIVPLVFFSIASGKLATYILPCFVPFSLIVAAGISTVAQSSKSFRTSTLVAGLVVFVFLIALVLFAANTSEGELVFAANEWPKRAALYGSLILTIASLAIAFVTSNQLLRVFCIGLCAVPFMLALQVSMPIAVLSHKAPEQFLTDICSRLPRDTALVTNGSLVRSMSWSCKRTDIYVIEDGGETGYGLSAPGAEGRFLTSADFGQLLKSENNVLLVCKGQCREATTEHLPKSAVRSSFGNFYAYEMLEASEPMTSTVSGPHL